MKQLTCEMCGSTNMIKQDGVFVCQSCGIKYSVEEARKLMIEGTVEVQGTVKLDNSAFVEKYLANARRAKQKEDWEETEKYYNMVEQNDPNNIEAIFYSAYGKARSSLVDEDIYKRQAIFKVLVNCISILDDKYDINRREENREAITSIAADLGALICSTFVYTQWKNGYGIVTRTNQGETYVLFGNLLDAYKETIANIAQVDDQPYMHEVSIKLYGIAQNTGIGNWKMLMGEWIAEERAALERIRRKTVDTYWQEHPEEKTRLEHERTAINSEIQTLTKSLDNLPMVSVMYRINAEIHGLMLDKDALGMFKSKEKQAIQERINGLNRQLAEAQTELNASAAPIQAEINLLKQRIQAIYQELNSVH